MTLEEIKNTIIILSNKAWSSTGEEQKARLRELLTLYDMLIEREEDPFYTYENKARVHAYLKENDQAEASLLKMTRINPQHVIAFYLLAEVRYDAGNYEGALEAIDQCIKNEFYADHRFNLRARINRALGRLEDAENDQQVYDDYQAREKAKWDDPDHYYHYK